MWGLTSGPHALGHKSHNSGAVLQSPLQPALQAMLQSLLQAPLQPVLQTALQDPPARSPPNIPEMCRDLHQLPGHIRPQILESVL